MYIFYLQQFKIMHDCSYYYNVNSEKWVLQKITQ